MKQRTVAAALAVLMLAGCGDAGQGGADTAAAAADEPKQLNVYNWSDYIAEGTVPGFERHSGIRVTYDVFDSNELLEAKLLAGGSGYDVVVPSLSFLGRQIQAGVFQPLDKRKIPNLANLDPAMMRRIAQQDPGNAYAVPYLWGTTGIGYNVDKIQAAFGSTEVVGSWDLVFKPENLAKLKGCGVTFLDTASEIVPTVLHYLGEDPNSTDPKVIAKAAAKLEELRPYIQNFHSSQYIDALAKGSTCLVVGWSGDILQARDRAEEAKNGVRIAYSIPREGALQFFDMLAIPKDAKHPENAHRFINYLLTPDVAAANTNFVSYPNAVPASTAMVDAAISGDRTIYPPPEVQAKLFALAVMPPAVDRQYTRLWTELKTGR
ncbi:polyamine ABC transporter substrate-binding protein [Xanthomonas sp. AmX2]|uniref:polyamine ABC transporter substrate-binding protein n=1 Tax=Xanthomonas sp. TaxID=29446 RepID=UPI001980555C|nr:polyamine ABC transporter substrate-binding protein [Xanthomonas sp.]MBN6148911.1 polyamine ABC transporter substrate-binding protein [Xanthomonas sp.]